MFCVFCPVPGEEQRRDYLHRLKSRVHCQPSACRSTPRKAVSKRLTRWRIVISQFEMYVFQTNHTRRISGVISRGGESWRTWQRCIVMITPTEKFWLPEIIGQQDTLSQVVMVLKIPLESTLRHVWYRYNVSGRRILAEEVGVLLFTFRLFWAAFPLKKKHVHYCSMLMECANKHWRVREYLVLTAKQSAKQPISCQ